MDGLLRSSRGAGDSDEEDSPAGGTNNDRGSQATSQAGRSHATSDIMAGMSALRHGLQSLASLFDGVAGRPSRPAGGGGGGRGWFDHDPFNMRVGEMDIMSLLMGLSGGGDGEWGGTVVTVRVNRWTPGAAAAALVTPQLQAQLYASVAAAPHRLRQSGRPWRTELLGEGAIDAGGPFAGACVCSHSPRMFVCLSITIHSNPLHPTFRHAQR